MLGSITYFFTLLALALNLMAIVRLAGVDQALATADELIVIFPSKTMLPPVKTTVSRTRNVEQLTNQLPGGTEISALVLHGYPAPVHDVYVAGIPTPPRAVTRLSTYGAAGSLHGSMSQPTPKEYEPLQLYRWSTGARVMRSVRDEGSGATVPPDVHAG